MSRKVISVRLTFAEILTAAHVGIMRQTQNLKNRKEPMYKADPSRDWQMHIDGCLGEMAVAKHYGLYWTGNVGNLAAKDVHRLQVRTRPFHNWDLILHSPDEKQPKKYPGDDDRDTFILVTGINGYYKIQGWILCADGKALAGPEYDKFDTGRPCHWLEQKHLHCMSELEIIR